MSVDRNNRSNDKGLFVTGPVLPVDDDEEATELVAIPRQRSRMVLVFAAMAGAATVVAVALLILGLRDTEEISEDALTLYQVARELHEVGESESALETLKRARGVAETPRAIRQIEQLEREITTAPLLKEAQQLVQGGRHAEARARLVSLLEVDSSNEKALLLMRLLPEEGAAKRPALAAVQQQPVPAAASDPLEPVAAPQPVPAGQSNQPEAVADGEPRPARRAVARAATRRQVARQRRASRARRGTLYVESSVGGALLVDGVRRGRAPGSLVVPAGPHVVEVTSLSDPTLRARRRVVVVAGRASRVRLDPPEPPAGERTREQVVTPAKPKEAKEPEARPARRQPSAAGETKALPPTDNINPW